MADPTQDGGRVKGVRGKQRGKGQGVRGKPRGKG